MARILKVSHGFTCTPRVHPLTEWTIPIYACFFLTCLFPPAEGDPYLPTPEEWKVELAWMGCHKCHFMAWLPLSCIVFYHCVAFDL